jgi:formylglycine-generating enzyme required for sulfatase activity
MKLLIVIVAFCGIVSISSATQAVQIETVLVGNAGNAADTQIMSDGTTGYGAVPYEYRIGKYEVTNAQWVEFLNTVDPMGTNERRLYDPGMTLGPTPQFGGIDFHASAANGSKYATQAGRETHPVLYVTWYRAIRFANWLHNGQGSGDTETGAYTLGPLLFPSAVPLNGKDIARNPGARWFLPSEDEWYKAAYHKNDGVTGNYWDYPTRSDIAPSDDLPPGGTNSANIRAPLEPVLAVGSYPLTYGPYGAFDQAGNVSEWNEALLSYGSNLSQVTRGQRDGAASQRGASQCHGGGNSGCGSIYWGFRVASAPTVVPEPSTALLLSGVAVALVTRRRVRVVVTLRGTAMIWDLRSMKRERTTSK